MKTILYVEDHPPSQMLMEAIIDEFTPHQLILADDGEQAQQIIQDAKPDLYIVDMDLPDTDGLTLAKTLYALHPAPIVLVSAYAEAIDEKILDHVVNFYLAKPMDPENVAEIIRRALA